MDSTCSCGEQFNPALPAALYGNTFLVDGVQCCPDCTRALLDDLQSGRASIGHPSTSTPHR